MSTKMFTNISKKCFKIFQKNLIKISKIFQKFQKNLIKISKKFQKISKIFKKYIEKM